ncbi:MAG: hypothetical protein M0R80_02885 [Proteobacteria bacterium]|jgi:hypothetical protein|nr:hypothetical protein [Pseudomonadota bacterium]
MEFKYFILNEGRAYLGIRLGDILNATQDLEQNAKSMGSRQLVSNAEGIVNQIRRVLHTHWDKQEEESLKKLQKAAVALARAIEEKDDLLNTITSVKGELEELVGDLGQPIGELGKPEGGKEAKEQEETPQPQPQQTQQPGPPPAGPPQPQQPSPQMPGQPQ